MLTARLVAAGVGGIGLRLELELLGDKPDQRQWRGLTNAERSTWKAQVAEGQRETDAIVIPALAHGGSEVLIAEGVVPDNLALVARRRQKTRPLHVIQQPPSGHDCLPWLRPPREPRRPLSAKRSFDGIPRNRPANAIDNGMADGMTSGQKAGQL
jgi:hypothetical protein